MTRRSITLLLVTAVAFGGVLGATTERSPSALAQGANKANPGHGAARMGGEFEGTPFLVLAPLLGDWEVEAVWSDGSRLWSRNEFRVGLGGSFLSARTFAKEADGEVYERYNTIYSYEAASATWHSYAFRYDGTVSVVNDLEVATERDQLSLASQWVAGDQEIKQLVRLTSDDSFNWKVWARPVGGREWAQIMDGDWHRVEP